MGGCPRTVMKRPESLSFILKTAVADGLQARFRGVDHRFLWSARLRSSRTRCHPEGETAEQSELPLNQHRQCETKPATAVSRFKPSRFQRCIFDGVDMAAQAGTDTNEKQRAPSVGQVRGLPGYGAAETCCTRLPKVSPRPLRSSSFSRATDSHPIRRVDHRLSWPAGLRSSGSVLHSAA